MSMDRDVQQPQTDMAANALKNVVVVGGSYVGKAAAKELANLLPSSHRVILIEPHTHFHHLFAFPRFAILPSHEHKAFIPYTSLFSSSSSSSSSPSSHLILPAKVLSLSTSPRSGNLLTLDRPVPFPSSLSSSPLEKTTKIPFDFLLCATGTRLSPPGTSPHDTKPLSISFLQSFQNAIVHPETKHVVIVGGGAVGVQMACDLKELYPAKRVTLVHSRQQLMPVYHERLSEIIKERFAELGVETVLGKRAVVPPEEGGWPLPVPGEEGKKKMEVRLVDGSVVEGDAVVQATGQEANNQFLVGLEEKEEEKGRVINPRNGFVKVKPTMQFADERFSNFMFAVGDIADSGAHKAARPGMVQAAVAARNVVKLIDGGKQVEDLESVEVQPAAIHLTLGLTKNIIFRNPNAAAGQIEPTYTLKDDGSADMGVDRLWVMNGIKVNGPQEYHL
ncbi:FAD/NAD(P)-binding domain-containing protein [Neurospora crassa]|uniref:Oxidoreductase n=1 Tax=Neurospora crassa (strain ATCC 24698 / 74-OR23-1A / CBS 708.71 / DSM 1257 / FGSC 987) TaxID=367110 RepID=V5IL80_NEUCR|nr:oxidoreductase [Neurospora crassa OR74A]ESA41799.1 oxidoreductase [Neurospora crassa OR74A]KHE80385.1 FAD/NAD(P)-binding domain-containing protein [Neurospora crassa]|eukprot:XP_011395340.1 oxidoreductase [Neurospora crassa OR74A]